MSDYTPKTSDIRNGYVLLDNHHYAERRAASFDRWYAEEIRKAKEEAWDECAKSVYLDENEWRTWAAVEPNPYRAS